MVDIIISSLITGGLALIGVVLTNISSNSKIQNEMKVNQEVTGTKLEELTREVRKHNNFAERIPLLEEKIKVINHRLDDIEEK